MKLQPSTQGALAKSLLLLTFIALSTANAQTIEETRGYILGTALANATHGGSRETAIHFDLQLDGKLTIKYSAVEGTTAVIQMDAAKVNVVELDEYGLNGSNKFRFRCMKEFPRCIHVFAKSFRDGSYAKAEDVYATWPNGIEIPWPTEKLRKAFDHYKSLLPPPQKPLF